jgi:hypothetical protein
MLISRGGKGWVFPKVRQQQARSAAAQISSSGSTTSVSRLACYLSAE